MITVWWCITSALGVFTQLGSGKVAWEIVVLFVVVHSDWRWESKWRKCVRRWIRGMKFGCFEECKVSRHQISNCLNLSKIINGSFGCGAKVQQSSNWEHCPKGWRIVAQRENEMAISLQMTVYEMCVGLKRHFFVSEQQCFSQCSHRTSFVVARLRYTLERISSPTVRRWVAARARARMLKCTGVLVTNWEDKVNNVFYKVV